MGVLAIPEFICCPLLSKVIKKNPGLDTFPEVFDPAHLLLQVPKIQGDKMASSKFFWFLLLVSCSVNASIDTGLNWIQSQGASDGSFASAGISTVLQSTSEASDTLHAVGQVAPAATLQWFNTSDAQTTEALSRKIIALAANGLDVSALLSSLVSTQNTDGGFGEGALFQSTAVDTAYALKALAAAKYADSIVLSRAIGFVLSTQLSDGSFDLFGVNTSSVYVTATVSSALQKYRLPFRVDANISAANQFLLRQRSANGGWASDWETAAALLALSSSTADASVLQPDVNVLLSHQGSDGAWEGNVYSTALATQALWTISQHSSTTPSVGSAGQLSGTIVDISTNLPIAGATVSVGSISQQSGNDGRFVLNNVPVGAQVASVNAPGFLASTTSVNMPGAGVLDLGTILMSSESASSVFGHITDATGTALAGAIINVGGVSATTDAAGMYRMAAIAGTYSVSVDAQGFQPITTTLVIPDRTHLNFSPQMNTLGTTIPTSTSLSGVVVASGSQIPLAGAQIQVGQQSILSDSTGKFSVSNVPQGALSFSVSAPGFVTTQSLVMVSGGGNFDVGKIYLTVMAGGTGGGTANSPAVYGTVTDSKSRSPVAFAELISPELGVNVRTDAYGHYSIPGASLKQFTLQASAPGYVARAFSVSVTNFPSVLDLTLDATSVSGITIDAFNSAAPAYPALTSAELSTTLKNAGSVEQQVGMKLVARDLSGRLIDEHTISPRGGGWHVIPAGGDLPLGMIWATGQNPAGSYQIRLEVFGQDGGILAERVIPLDILETHRIGGVLTANPPITIAEAKQPVSFVAQIANTGNVDLDNLSVTTQVVLKNRGAQLSSSISSVETMLDGGLLKSAAGMAVDNLGRVYVCSVENKLLLRRESDGTVSTVMSGFINNPIDVAVADNGDVYVVTTANELYILRQDGSKLSIQTGLTKQSAVEPLSNGSAAIADATGLYSVDLTGAKTLIVGTGLSTPHAVAAAPNGSFYVASQDNNTVFQYSKGVLTPFIINIEKPYGVAVDGASNVYATSYSRGEIWKASPDGTVSTLASGLSSPYAIAIKPDGTLIVSNTGTNEILELSQAGVVVARHSSPIYRPIDVAEGSAGNLLVLNQGAQNVVRIGADGQLLNSYSVPLPPVDLLNEPSLGELVLGGSALKKVDGTSVCSNLNGATAMTSTPDGIIVAEYSAGHLITCVGGNTEYVPPTLQSVQSVALGTDGAIYALSRNSYNGYGYVTRVAPDFRVSRSGYFSATLGAVSGIGIDSLGRSIIYSSTKRALFRIDSTGTPTQIAALAIAPVAIAVDPTDVVVYAYGKDIYKVDVSGTVSIVRSLPYSIAPNGIAYGADAALWVAHGADKRVSRISPDGTLYTYSLSFAPTAIGSDGAGGAYVSGSGQLLHVTAGGAISSVTQALDPNKTVIGVATNSAGVLVLTNDSVLTRLSPQGVVLQRFVGMSNPRALAYTPDGLYYLNGAANQIARLATRDSLGEIIGSGYYSKLRYIGGKLLLVSNTAVDEVVGGAIVNRVTGLSTGGGVALTAAGEFVVTDGELNLLKHFNSNWQLLRSEQGMVAPKGVVAANDGTIYFVNGFPEGVSQIKGNSASRILDLKTAGYLGMTSDGRLLAASGAGLTTVNTDGSNPSFMAANVEGVTTSLDGIVVTQRTVNVLGLIKNQSVQVLSAGLTGITDIKRNTANVLNVAVSGGQSVLRLSGSNAFELVETGFQSIKSIAFDNKGGLYVAHGKRLTYCDATKARSDLNTNLLDVAFSGTAIDGNGRVYVAEGVKGRVHRFVQTPASVPATGLVVYEKTSPLGLLTQGQSNPSMDLGAWVPTESGDYDIRVIASDGSESTLQAQVHVGAGANGSLSTATPTVSPGTVAVQANMSVSGHDYMSLAQLDTTRPISVVNSSMSGYYGGFPFADKKGNVYLRYVNGADAGFYRFAPDGSMTKMPMGNVPIWGSGDSSGNLYYGIWDTVYRRDVNGVSTPYATLPGLISSVAVSPDNTVYALRDNMLGGDLNAVLYRLRPGGFDTVSTTIPYGNDFAISSTGDFYFANVGRNFGEVEKISRDGLTSTRIGKFGIEHEGGPVITSGCGGNAFITYVEPWEREEQTIREIVAATGKVRDVASPLRFEATLPGGGHYFQGLTDMEGLVYDPVGKRVIAVGEVGGLSAIPITCGGIDVEARVVLRDDVSVLATDPAPTRVEQSANGTVYVWRLANIDDAGINARIDASAKDMVENETRPLFKEAYLVFQNQFVPGQEVKVPVAIPTIQAKRDIRLNATVSANSLGANADLGITSVVGNYETGAFSGSLVTSIETTSGVTVVTLSDAVVATAGGSETTITENWNTSSIYVGPYVAHVVLKNALGQLVTEQRLPFQITTGEGTVPALQATLTADKLSYDAWGRVQLTANITNTATNATFNPAAAALVITRPDGSVVYSGSAVVGALYPKAGTSVPFTVFLADEPSETLTATLSVIGADGLSMAGAATSFTVVRTPTAGLIGYVDTTSGWVYQGDPNTCTETVTNYGAADVANATVRHQLISIATGQVLQEKTNVRTLTGSGTQVDTWSIATQGMPIGDYGCVLSVLVAGQEKSLAMGGFQVKEPPIKIAAQWNPGTQGRVLVLLDHPVNDDDHTESCEKRGEELTLLTPAAGVPLTAAVEAQLLDAQGTVVATTHLPAAANDDNGNLAVVAFDANGLSVRVRSEGAHVYAVKTTLVSNGNTVQYTTGPMTIDCQGPLVKQSVGDFTVVEADSASNDPARPTLVAQQAFLEGLLKADHWNYTVVNDATAFANELHHGGYSAYLLLNRKVKLPETLQRELVEAVNRGEGLLVAGDHDDHNHKLEEALGISHRGKLAMAGGVSVAGTDWLTAGQGAFAFNAHANRVQLNGASVIGRYTGVVIGHESDAPDNDEDDRQDTTVVLENDVAVTSFTYGRGRSLYVGFDLLAEATQTGNASFFGELLRRTASHAHPDQIEMKGGVAIPLIVHLENQGMAVSGQVVATLPAGTRVIDAASGTVQPDGTVLWPYTLAVGQSLDLPLLAIYSDGPQMVTANVQAMKSGLLTDYSTVTNTLTLAPAPSWDNALLSASALPKSNTGFTRTSRDLGQAKSAFDKLLYVDALNFLTKAAQPLKGTSDTAANDLRFTIDDLIRDVAGRLP